MTDALIADSTGKARALFDLPRDVVYFNCAYLSPMLKTVAAAGKEGVERKSRPWECFPHHFFDESNQVRDLFGKIIGSSGKNISIVPSVSYAIGVAARNIPASQGSNIVVLSGQFPSNVYPWMAKAKESGANLRIVERPEDHNWTPAVIEAIGRETAVAALPNCHWADGSKLDLVAIGRHCRALDVPLVLDLTQSLGALPFSVEEVQPAFVAAAGYKWLMGPYSVGYLYADSKYHGGNPLEYNWITRDGAENFAGLVNYTDQLAEDASRFDMGERSNFTLLPMALAALRQVVSWDPAQTQAKLSAYNDDLAKSAAKLGFETLPDHLRVGHIIGLRYPGALPGDLSKRLVENNIFVSVRGDAIRVAPHLYNDDQDKATFLSALKSCMEAM